MDYSSVSSLVVAQIGSFGIAALVVLTAILGVALGLLVFRWGWKQTLQVSGEGIPYTLRSGNFPGSAGYNSRRGSGASSGNVARMESEGSSGKKINMLG